jgi:CBS domain-containing protein
MTSAAEIMNRKFYYASQAESVGTILQEMTERGLGSVPVLDLEGRPLGIATMAQIERCYDVEELTNHLARPAACVHQSTPAEVAARMAAVHQADLLLLVDDHGLAVGCLTALDLLRAVLGLHGSRTQTNGSPEEGWDAAELLELSAVHRAPEAPGIVLLCSGLDKDERRIVWAEAAENMRERLDEMLRNPQANPQLETLLNVYPRTLRFQCLTVHDETQRKQLASSLGKAGESGDAAGGAPQHAPSASVSASQPSIAVPAAGSAATVS